MRLSDAHYGPRPDVDASLDSTATKWDLWKFAATRAKPARFHADISCGHRKTRSARVAEQAPLLELTTNWDPQDYDGVAIFRTPLPTVVDNIHDLGQSLQE